MKQEDRDLLLRYLSMALPYGVKVKQGDRALKLIGIRPLFKNCVECELSEDTSMVYPIEGIKPYLRPMSSMTEEEEREYGLLCFDVSYYDKDTPNCSFKLIKWLLEKHLDFIGLIPKGLAIEVTEENNPYK